MTITVRYECDECGKKEALLFASAQEAVYADDCLEEEGWIEKSPRVWVCPACAGGSNAS